LRQAEFLRRLDAFTPGAPGHAGLGAAAGRLGWWLRFGFHWRRKRSREVIWGNPAGLSIVQDRKFSREKLK
jgi:hypothetical protein